MPRRDKSFYDLAFGVDPGGARKDAHFIRGSLEAIKTDLAGELADQLNLYLLCWYGARLELHVWQRGTLTARLDLHPLITIDIAGDPTITFTGPGAPVGYDFSNEEVEEDDDSLSSRMFEGSLDDVKVTVAWDRLAVPALEGDLVRDGDFVNVDGDWLDDDDLDEDELRDNGYLPVGFTDREG